MVYRALPYQSLSHECQQATFYILLGHMLPDFLYIPSFPFKYLPFFKYSSKCLEINQEHFEVLPIVSVLLVLERNFAYMTRILHLRDSFL